MNDPNTPEVRGWIQPPGLGGIYPGLGGSPEGFGGPGFGGDPFLGPPALFNPGPFSPYGGPPKGLLFSDIKQLVDRMGGIDGILSGIGKFQKFISAMQQMAPLLRLLFGKGASTKAASLGIGDDFSVKPKRSGRRSSRSRRRTSSSRRRPPRR